MQVIKVCVCGKCVCFLFVKLVQLTMRTLLVWHLPSCQNKQLASNQLAPSVPVIFFYKAKFILLSRMFSPSSSISLKKSSSHIKLIMTFFENTTGQSSLGEQACAQSPLFSSDEFQGLLFCKTHQFLISVWQKTETIFLQRDHLFWISIKTLCLMLF